MTRTYAFTVDGGRVRLDRFLGEALREQDVSREKVKRAIRDGGCLVDGAVCTDVSAKVGAGQSIELRMEAEPTSVQPEEGELEILYQDAWLAVLNKPAGMTVHPAPSCPDGTLVHRLVARFPSLRAQEGFRPGIVHRLDKDTTGAMLVAKNDEAHQKLSKDIARRDVVREYLAIVRGNVAEDDAVIDMPIGRSTSDRKKQAVNLNGRSALTRLHVLERFGDYTLVKLRLQTGRTHQIRVHMSYIGRPVAGDPTYGGKLGELGLEAQALHSWRIEFTHPKTLERMSFEAEPPEDFKKALELLRSRQKR